MINYGKLLAGLLALGVSGCATSRGPHLVMGPAAAPPTGFVDFCVRQPGDCGLSDAKGVEGPIDPDEIRRHANELFWRSAFADARAGHAQHGNETGQTAANAAQLSGMGQSDLTWPNDIRDRQIDDWAGSSTPLEFSDRNRQLIEVVNETVNHTIIPREANATRGNVDEWSNAESDGGSRYGDCKKYVLEKRRRLTDAGIPGGVLSIAVANVDGENHAVLIVSTDRGQYVLDNLTSEIRLWEQVPYRWIERQRTDDPLEWASVRAISTAGG